MTQIKPTIAHMLGEMVWVCSQSPIYKNLKIADIEWQIVQLQGNMYKAFPMRLI